MKNSLWKKKLEEFKKKKSSIERINNKKQHSSGKLTARERIKILLDKNTFNEMGLFVKSDHEKSKKILADGVVTGYGEIDGRKVFIYAQDFTHKGGTLGEKHAEKIAKVMKLAIMTGCPIIGIEDSGGARIQEGVKALNGYSKIFYLNTKASGVVPQISVVLGPCAGGAVYSPALTDFIFMVKGISKMFITGPRIIKSVLNENVTMEKLGGAETHANISGVAHFEDSSETASLIKVRKLLSYLPSNNRSEPPILNTGDKKRRNKSTKKIVSPDPEKGYEMKKLIVEIFDKGSCMEIKEDYAKNLITCLARLDSQVVGVIANQPKDKAGCLDIDASSKAARFVRFCDSFNIPIINLVDVPGYLPGQEQEHEGIIRHGAELLYAYAEATIPKIAVIVRKAYGGGYIVMASKEMGYDMVLAWPFARIAVMGGKQAAEIIYKDKEEKKTLIDEYEKKYLNPYCAAEEGFVDKIISPADTRNTLIDSLDILKTKRDKIPPRKHGVMPL